MQNLSGSENKNEVIDLIFLEDFWNLLNIKRCDILRRFHWISYKIVRKQNSGQLAGTVGTIKGFSFTVYSNDHGKHFHVIDKGKGINARFSFPQIELLNYKTKNKIRPKDIKLIKNYFSNPANFIRLEFEFQKRGW